MNVIPVKNDCVKKNPDTQKVIGVPLSIHSWKKLSL